MTNDTLLMEKYDLLLPHLDERTKRLYLASEAIGYGRGGQSKVSRLAKVSRVTIAAGIKELRVEGVTKDVDKRIRKKGGGRKKSVLLEENLIGACKN